MKTNNLTFLSHAYNGNTPSYGNKDMIKIVANSSITSGETSNSSCWIFTNNHIGTHIDTPYHFSNAGKKIIDIPLNDWIFKNVALIDIPCTKAIILKDRDFDQFTLNSDIEILLIRTNYESYRGKNKYWNDNPGLSPEVASSLRRRYPRLRCIGFDFISLTSWKYKRIGRESHKEFLAPEGNRRPVLVIEDMSLKSVKTKINWLIVAPIIVEDGNGAPVTVIASQA